MLRGTLGAFGAGVGGADAVTVLPFDTALGLPDAFSRRIARNTQALLIMESHLARVVDPAGGSWYVESLTDALARRAWEVFTGIERAGGLAAVLADGSLAGTIAEAWHEREHRLATRTEPVTGVSEFPNLTERLPERPAATRPAPRGVLPRVRPAAAFEALRARADAHAAAHGGTRPSVFLATLGPPAAHTARLGFASNLFQSGGLDTPSGGGSPEETVAAFRESGSTVACLCGSDKLYAAEGAAVASALAGAGARVLLAGAPGAVDVPGISDHVYTGCDAVEVLTGTLSHLGVD
jgi:methylmalonyl-CoA mutase